MVIIGVCGKLSLLEAPWLHTTANWIHNLHNKLRHIYSPSTTSKFRNISISFVYVIYFSLCPQWKTRCFLGLKKKHSSHRCASFNHKNTNRFCCSVSLARRRRSGDLQRAEPSQQGNKLSNDVVATSFKESSVDLSVGFFCILAKLMRQSEQVAAI